MSIQRVLFFGILLTTGGVAEARQQLRCNRAQTKCTTDLQDTTIGDKVGIYDKDGSLVAKGRVSGMKGGKRALRILKRTGKIRRTYSVSLLANPSVRMSRKASSKSSSYSAYSPYARWSLGLDAGALRSGPGKGLETSAYVDRQLADGAYITGRGLYQTIDTSLDYPEVLDNRGDVAMKAESLPGEVKIMAVMVGAKFSKRMSKGLSLFAEAVGGAAMVDYVIDGDPALAQPEDSDLPEGTVPMMRVTSGAKAHFDTWNVGLISSLTQLQRMRGFSLGASVGKDLP